MLKLLNNHCPELETFAEGPRLEGRVNLTIVVMVVPCEGGQPQIDQAFPAVTKEFSCNGVSLVLQEPMGLGEVIIGFRWEWDMKFLRGKAMHLNPMGAGFYQLGLKLSGVVPASDYPGLESLTF
jgi:hypothetical protein